MPTDTTSEISDLTRRVIEAHTKHFPHLRCFARNALKPGRVGRQARRQFTQNMCDTSVAPTIGIADFYQFTKENL